MIGKILIIGGVIGNKIIFEAEVIFLDWGGRNLVPFEECREINLGR